MIKAMIRVALTPALCLIYVLVMNKVFYQDSFRDYVIAMSCAWCFWLGYCDYFIVRWLGLAKFEEKEEEDDEYDDKYYYDENGDVEDYWDPDEGDILEDEEQKEPIPKWVFYAERGDYFGQAVNRLHLPSSFYEQWKPRVDEFPRLWFVREAGHGFGSNQIGHSEEEAIANFLSVYPVPEDRVESLVARKS